MTWLGNSLPENAATESTLADLNTTTFENSSDTVGLLNKILKELKLLNLHIATMTGEKFTKNDVIQGD